MTLPATHADIRAAVLSSYESEYRDLLEAWKLVESKAQGAIAIAGIFLAAAFSFAKDLNEGPGFAARLSLVVSIASLLLAVLLAVMALAVRNVPRWPAGKTIEDVANPLLKAAEAGLPLFLSALANDQIEVWRDTNSRLAKALASKASKVALSQWCIFCSATVFVIYTSVVILNR
jgi:hypothetical protein